MQSIASIVGDVLTSKETWFRKIKKSSEPGEESIGFVQNTKNRFKDPSKGDCSKRGRGGRNNSRKGSKCKRCRKTGHTSDQCWASWESIKDMHNQKTHDQNASKSSDSCIVAHCNLGFNEMTSLSSYKDCWLLDTGATSHMTFRKDCFEELNETIDGIVYFADKSSIKPKGMGTIRLKMSGFLDFSLKNVLYLLDLKRSLLSLVEIQ